MSAVTVRPRTDADIDACVEIATAVHELDVYPSYIPTDLRTFLVSSGAYGAWVAEDGGVIVGHVALHHRSVAPPVAVAVASGALRQPPERLGVVARLLVAPWGRRRGAGQALLEVAAGDAVARGLWPVLDVAARLEGAIQLYEACGWTRVGAFTFPLPDGTSLDEFAYIGPISPTTEPHRHGDRP